MLPVFGNLLLGPPLRLPWNCKGSFLGVCVVKHKMLPVFGIWLLGGSPEIAMGLQRFFSGRVCYEARNAARFRNLAFVRIS